MTVFATTQDRAATNMETKMKKEKRMVTNVTNYANWNEKDWDNEAYYGRMSRKETKIMYSTKKAEKKPYVPKVKTKKRNNKKENWR